MKLIYGFYRISDVATHMKMAREAGINHFDTAQLYGNERACAENAIEGDTITTKIYEGRSIGQIKKRIDRSLSRFKNRKTSPKIDTILLHRPLPNLCWKGLVQYADNIPSLGISNYDRSMLVDLLTYCDENNLRKPDVHQMEVHPFVNCDAMIKYCQAQGIRVEGHTVLTQGKFFEYPALQRLRIKYNVSPVAILMAWARSKNIDICINTRSSQHLSELIESENLVLFEEDLNDMNTWHEKTPYRFYKSDCFPHSPDEVENMDDFIAQIVSQLQQDIASIYPSVLCEQIPITGDAYRKMGRFIAQRLYPDLKSEHALLKLRADIKQLRTQRAAQHKVERNRKKGLSCCVVPRTEGEYSESIIHPQAMPVDVTDPSEFIPYFEYLTSATNPPDREITFVRGTMFPDGRLDLCKQVVGPTSIEALCETVNQSQIVRHFLLGNNVALQDNEDVGARALASVMSNNDKPIETWYLAGNCIGSTGAFIISEALKYNNQCKALWLKRNPIGPLGARDLNSMLRINSNLVLLDLHNCALGTEGVQNLFKYPSEMKTLKHVYLDANAIESTESIAEWCKVAPVTTLSLSINRLGDDEIMCLAHALRGSSTLKRLFLSSTHMDNRGVHFIVEMALSCPKLISLNLGTYKSSKDLGEWPGNFFDDAVIPELTQLINESTSLQYLNLIKCRMSPEGIASLPLTSRVSMDCHSMPSHYVHDKARLRLIKHPKRVLHIDSIYRNKM